MTGQTEEKMCRGGWATYKNGPGWQGNGNGKDGGPALLESRGLAGVSGVEKCVGAGAGAWVGAELGLG
jgi:hypothetical protein